MGSSPAPIVDLWTAGASGLWSNGADWSLGAPPTAAEAVEILGPATVTYSGGASAIAGFQLGPATLNLTAGVLTDTGAAQFNFATLGGAGTLVAQGQTTVSGLTLSATLDITGASSLVTRAVTGAGTLEIGGGDTSFESVTSLAMAHWLLAGGQTLVYGDLTYAGSFTGDSGARLTTSGHVYLTGAATLAGLQIDGQGGLALEGASRVSGVLVGLGVELADIGGSVVQSGGAVTLSGTDALAIFNGGVWDIADASGIVAGAHATLLIGETTTTATTGLFEKTGAGVSVVQASVINNLANGVTAAGVQYQGVEVTAGTLDFKSEVQDVNGASKTGSDNIVGAGTLEFDSLVRSQAIGFFGAGGTLALNDLAGFGGAIAGFDTTGSHDTLLIGGGYKFVGAHDTATSATLAFSLNGNTTTLTLTGNYAHAHFCAHTLAGGVLEITG